MSDAAMKQCRLVRQSTHLVAWIPASFAVKGRVVDVRSRWSRDEWSPGWTVETVYDGARDQLEVREHQRIDLPSLKP